MDMYWECLTRVVSVNDDLLRTMSEAGCKSVLYGIETGYEEGWKKINKPITKDMVRKAVHLAQKNHILVKASFVTGFPWEGEHELRQTINFAKELNPEIVFFTTLNPFPGTYIWDQYFRENNTYFAKGADMNSYIYHGADPLIRTKYLTPEQLEYWNGRGYLEFYLRPSYIFKRLKGIRNLTELKRNLVSGKGLLKLAVKRILSKQQTNTLVQPQEEIAQSPFITQPTSSEAA